MYKQNLGLNNHQELIWYKTQPTNYKICPQDKFVLPGTYSIFPTQFSNHNMIFE